MEQNYIIVTLCISHINATHVMQPNNCGRSNDSRKRINANNVTVETYYYGNQSLLIEYSCSTHTFALRPLPLTNYDLDFQCQVRGHEPIRVQKGF